MWNNFLKKNIFRFSTSCDEVHDNSKKFKNLRMKHLSVKYYPNGPWEMFEISKRWLNIDAISKSAQLSQPKSIIACLKIILRTLFRNWRNPASKTQRLQNKCTQLYLITQLYCGCEMFICKKEASDSDFKNQAILHFRGSRLKLKVFYNKILLDVP